MDVRKTAEEVTTDPSRIDEVILKSTVEQFKELINIFEKKEFSQVVYDTKQPAKARLGAATISFLSGSEESKNFYKLIMSEKDKEFRLGMAKLLWEYRGADVELLAVINNEKEDSKLRAEIIRSFITSGISTKEAVEAYRMAFFHMSPEVKEAGIDAIGRFKIKDKQIVDGLMKLLDSSSFGLRYSAVSALGDLGVAEAAPRLKEMMLKDPVDAIREACQESCRIIESMKAGPKPERM